MDYLNKIAGSTKLETIATMIRAQGCKVTAGLRMVHTPGQLLDMVNQYEQQAATIENCSGLAEARRLLKQWGFIGDAAKRDPNGNDRTRDAATATGMYDHE